MASKAATLELAVLGLLHETPLHGYELRKRLNLLMGWSRVLSYGSLYPALKRMLRAGWIQEEAAATSLRSRRQRIVYQITPEGTRHFTDAVSDSGPATWEDENFQMRFALFSRTDSDVRMRILEGRRSRLQERLDRARTAPSGSPARSDRYVDELHRHSIESMEREVRWLGELIAAEHSAQPRSPQGPTPRPQADNQNSPGAEAAARTEIS